MIDKKLEKGTKSLLFGMEFSHGIRRALISALMLIYFISLGFNVVSVTTLFAISTIIMMFFEFPTGAIADYDSRKKSILISLFLMSVAFFGLFIFKNFWLLAFSWILGDIAWTFSSGANTGWAIDNLKYGKKKSKLLSLISNLYIWGNTGRVIGGLIGLVIVAINFRLVWLIISVIYLILLFIFWKYAEERNFKPTKSPHNYLIKSIIKAKETISYLLHRKNRALRVLMIGGLLSIISMSAFFIALPLRFAQAYGLTPQYISGIYAVLSAIMLIGPIIANKLVKSDFRSSLFVSMVIMGIFIILFALSSQLILAIVLLAILQISLAANDVLQDSACHHEFSSKIRASLGSFNNIVWSVANSIAVFFAGLSISFLGLTITIIIAGAFSLVSALIFLIGLEEKK